MNIRPLWASATQALSDLCLRFAQPGWELIFHELGLAAAGDMDSLGGFVPSWREVEEEETLGLQEDEKTWRCPNRAKLFKVFEHWTEEWENEAQKRLAKVNYLCLIPRACY